jgi:hypothetical protein
MNDEIRQVLASMNGRNMRRPHPIPSELLTPGHPQRDIVRAGYAAHLQDCGNELLSKDQVAILREETVAVLAKGDDF